MSAKLTEGARGGRGSGEGGTPGLFRYYPRRRPVAPKLRAFIDHVAAKR